MPKPIIPKPTYHIPDPQRLRRINGSFAWIDHRLLRNGFLAVMTSQEQSLYLFLTLAADRNGVSFYRHERIGDQHIGPCGPIGIGLEQHLSTTYFL
jgi:hypothetical protein